MIQCTCTIHNCFCVVNYHSPITLQQVLDCPPFHNFPIEKDEHKHNWRVTKVEFRGNK